VAFGQFAKRQVILVFDSTDDVNLGTVASDTAIELEHILLELHVRGAPAGTERFRLKLYSNAELAGTPITSAWLAFADIEDLAADMLFRVRFDFAGEVLSKDQTYYVYAEPDGYARDGDSFWVGARLDHPYPVNTQLDALPAAYMAVVGAH
jgi:hypothetical protein